MNAPTIQARLRAHSGVLAPFFLYLVAVLMLGDWLVDDAGISFAYARNLAHGHGLVAQPGVAPVEGFSNFLWVVALAPTFALRLFHPVLTPKLLSALAVLVAFYRLRATMLTLTGRNAPGVALLVLLAIAPPLVVWTSSGLENGLTFLLVAALLDVLVRRPSQSGALTGLFAAMLAMSRPDGLVYGPATLVFLAATALLTNDDRARHARELAYATVTFSALTGGFFAFRYRTFGLLWPHTYEAKREHAGMLARARGLLAAPDEVFSKLSELAHATAGRLGPALFVAAALALVVLAARKRLTAAHAALVILLAASAAAFVFLERDWMGEARFATATVALAWALLVAVAAALTEHRPHAFVAGSALVALGAAVEAWPRILQFAEDPPTPYARVLAETDRIASYAQALGVSAGSVLAADVGAELVASPLRVYDLAGLCEPEAVRTLKGGSPIWRYDHPEFFAWIFTRAKPTFIVTRAFWSNVTAFTEDPRFTADYAAIDSYEDAYVARAYGRYVRSGLFVRRDVLTDPKALTRLRDLGPPNPSAAPPIVRLARALGLRPPPIDDARALELRAAMTHAEHLDAQGPLLEGRRAWQQIAERATREGDRITAALAHERLATGERSFEEDTQRRRRATAVTLLDEGLRAYRIPDHATAIQRWSLIPPTDPLWAKAQNNKASSLILLGALDQAEEALANARYADPREKHFERNQAWLEQEKAKAGEQRTQPIQVP